MIVTAYCLGKDNHKLEVYKENGQLKQLDENTYEIFSQEVHGGKGEVAYAGDFVKIDVEGRIYPNSAAYFLKNHIYLRDFEYEQIPVLLDAWTIKEEMCEEIEYLIREKGLVINHCNKDQCYKVSVNDTILSAGLDDMIVFYEIVRDEKGDIQDIDYHFVKKTIFDQTYQIVNVLQVPEIRKGEKVVLTFGPKNLLLFYYDVSWDLMIDFLWDTYWISQKNKQTLSHLLVSNAVLLTADEGMVQIPERLWQYLAENNPMGNPVVYSEEQFIKGNGEGIHKQERYLMDFASYVVRMEP